MWLWCMTMVSTCTSTRYKTPIRGVDYILDYSDLDGKPYNISFDSRSIRFNGMPSTLISGSIHYPRSTPGMWGNLFSEARAAGLNTIESYVFWNYHQRELSDYTNGRYDYSQRGNITEFLRLAQEANLFVIWRFGPYICAEWPDGGMPQWLHQIPNIHPRSADPVWEKVVATWAEELFGLIEPFLAKNGGPVIMTQAENEYSCRQSDPKCQAYMQSLHDLAEKLNTGLLWENCHGTLAPDMIGAANNCGGIAPPIGQQPRSMLPTTPGNFSDPSTFPAMITEDEQWFDAWGYGNVERSPENVAYGVAAFVATGGAMHNYYMFHGGNHYGNWSLYAETDNNTDMGGRLTGETLNNEARYTGPESFSNTVRYANAAPLHSDGTRNEPRFSHLTAIHMLLRQNIGTMLTTNGTIVPTTNGLDGCITIDSQTMVPSAASVVTCYAYGLNSPKEITFVIADGTTTASIYGRHLQLPGDDENQTLVVIASDRKTVLWNSTAPPLVNTSKHRIVAMDSPPLHFDSWNDSALKWFRTSFDTPVGSPAATLVDLQGMDKGMAFVNGYQIANYDLVVANCSVPFPQLVHWKPGGWCGKLQYVNYAGTGVNSTSDTYPDGGCGQPTQRYYHIPPDWLSQSGGNELLLAETFGSTSNPSSIRIVTRN